MKQLTISTVAFIVLGVGQLAWAHTEDFAVGINPATNQILVDYDPALYPWALPASDDPTLPGFALDDPGFVSLDASQAIPGVFEPLSPSADIRMQVLAVSSPELKVWDPLGPGEPGFQIIGSRLWNIGTPFFDTHPWWQIDTSDPNYNPEHSPWSVTFQLSDAAGIHLAADPLTVTFTPEPAPICALSVLAFAVRRHRFVS